MTTVKLLMSKDTDGCLCCEIKISDTQPGIQQSIQNFIPVFMEKYSDTIKQEVVVNGEHYVAINIEHLNVSAQGTFDIDYQWVSNTFVVDADASICELDIWSWTVLQALPTKWHELNNYTPPAGLDVLIQNELTLLLTSIGNAIAASAGQVFDKDVNAIYIEQIFETIPPEKNYLRNLALSLALFPELSNIDTEELHKVLINVVSFILLVKETHSQCPVALELSFIQEQFSSAFTQQQLSALDYDIDRMCEQLCSLFALGLNGYTLNCAQQTEVAGYTFSDILRTIFYSSSNQEKKLLH